MTFEEWAKKNYPGLWQTREVDFVLVIAGMCAAWNAGRADTVAEVSLLRERVKSYEQTLQKASDIMFPPLTRDDILHWPMSKDVLLRLRRELAVLVGATWDDSSPGALYIADRYICTWIDWQPDLDANHCKLVKAQVSQYECGRNQDGTYWAYVGPISRRQPIIASTEEIAFCLAVCNTTLVPC